MSAGQERTTTTPSGPPPGWNLPAFALRRPVSVMMATITLASIGLMAWSRLPIGFMIDISKPSLRLWIPYPGANPEQVEQEVAIPAEGILKTVTGMERITTSSSSGGCYIWIEFVWDGDMAVASAEVRDRMERLKLVLPKEITHLYLRRFSLEAIPIIRFALFRQEQSDELAQYARTKLRNRLLRIDGVAEVTVSGSTAENVYVDFDQDALARHRLSVGQVMAALQTDSINLGLGEVSDGRQAYFVRARDEYKGPDDLASAFVSPTGIRLRDVATVNYRGPSGADTFKVDGKQGVFFEVVKEAEANVVNTCDKIHAELDAIRAEPDAAGAEIMVFDDQSQLIRFALSGLYQSGEYGALLAILVLWLFLRRMGPTLVVASAIPLSIMAAPAYIFFTNRGLNLITIGAMLISVGMLVDNAIVVVENIHRHSEMGADRRLNIQRGASEVALAITASTITTLVVFIPVVYLPAGELTTIMREFAGPISITLTASLLMALTAVPVAEVYFERPARHLQDWFRWLGRWGIVFRQVSIPGGLRRIAAAFRRWLRPIVEPMEWVDAYYAEGLRATLRRRNVALAMLCAAIVATYLVPYQETGFRGLPDLDSRTVQIRFRADPNYGEENAEETVQRLVGIIEQQQAALGIEHVYVNSGAWGGDINVHLTRVTNMAMSPDYPCTTEQARNRINELLPPRVPGGTIDCGVSRIVPEEGSLIRVRLRGDDTATLESMATELARRMRTLSELNNVKSNMPEKEDEIQLDVDEELSAAVGLTPLRVAQSVDFALRGTNLPYIKREGREIAVRGQLEWADRGNKGDLESMELQTPKGQSVALTQVVDMQKGEALPSVYRTNAKSYTEIVGRAREKDLIPVRTALKKLVDGFELPRGYQVEVDENLTQIDVLLHNFKITVAMALVLIYLVVAALFESWLLPVSVMATVPLAYMGVYWSLHLTDTPMDTLSLVGSVILCGVIVNNGIVIVDHINGLRREGMDRFNAVVLGGRHRLRPVLMTTLTTILGIFPIAFGYGGADNALLSLGRALTGGLAVGTALTLFVVPMVYTLVDDLNLWVRQFLGCLLRMSARGQKPA